MEAIEKKTTITAWELTKDFFMSSQKILHEPIIQMNIGYEQFTVGYPRYIGVAEGKIIQRNDLKNFAKDFNRAVELAKIKVENGKTATAK